MYVRMHIMYIHTDSTPFSSPTAVSAVKKKQSKISFEY